MQEFDLSNHWWNSIAVCVGDVWVSCAIGMCAFKARWNSAELYLASSAHSPIVWEKTLNFIPMWFLCETVWIIILCLNHTSQTVLCTVWNWNTRRAGKGWDIQGSAAGLMSMKFVVNDPHMVHFQFIAFDWLMSIRCVIQLQTVLRMKDTGRNLKPFPESSRAQFTRSVTRLTMNQRVAGSVRSLGTSSVMIWCGIFSTAICPLPHASSCMHSDCCIVFVIGWQFAHTFKTG